MQRRGRHDPWAKRPLTGVAAEALKIRLKIRAVQMERQRAKLRLPQLRLMIDLGEATDTDRREYERLRSLLAR